MGQHCVGLDVSLETASVCVLDEAGAIVGRGEVASTPEALAPVIRARAPRGARLGLETGPLCTPGPGRPRGPSVCPSSAWRRGMPRRRCRSS